MRKIIGLSPIAFRPNLRSITKRSLTYYTEKQFIFPEESTNDTTHSWLVFMLYPQPFFITYFHHFYLWVHGFDHNYGVRLTIFSVLLNSSFSNGIPYQNSSWITIAFLSSIRFSIRLIKNNISSPVSKYIFHPTTTFPGHTLVL